MTMSGPKLQWDGDTMPGDWYAQASTAVALVVTVERDGFNYGIQGKRLGVKPTLGEAQVAAEQAAIVLLAVAVAQFGLRLEFSLTEMYA